MTALTLTQTVVVFARGDRLAVRLYDTPAEAREAGERAIRAGTADSYALANVNEVRRNKEVAR